MGKKHKNKVRVLPGRMIEQNANKSNKLEQDFVTGCKNNPGGLPGLAVRTAGRYSCAWEWHRRREPAY